jgi:MYXO-CTERM domain-containing protein
VVEAINWGLVPGTGAIAGATLDSFITHLQPPSGRGFFRNDDGGWYDQQEWVFIDLRAANAFRLAGRSAVADDLLLWATDQASLNQDLIAELHEATTADYEGAAPMVGFGAGAYLIALADRAAGAAADWDCGGGAVEPGETVDGGEDDGADGDGDADADADVTPDVRPDDGGSVDGADAGDGGGGGCSCRTGDGTEAGFGALATVIAGAFVARRTRRRR